MRKVDIQTTKGLLAKMMSAENITVEHRAGETTPHFMLAQRRLVLPVWEGISDHLYNLLVTHETGHALITPINGWNDEAKERARKMLVIYRNKPSLDAVTNAFYHIVNVVEDVRVDKRQQRRYPGVVEEYRLGLIELWEERDYFSTKNLGSFDKLSFPDRINLFTKGGSLKGIRFSPEESVILKRVLNDVVSFEDVLDISEEIFKLEKDNLDRMQMPDMAMAGEGAGEGSEGDPSDQNQQSGSKSKNKDKDDGSEKVAGGGGVPEDKDAEDKDAEDEDEGDSESEGDCDFEVGDGDGSDQGDSDGEDEGSGQDSENEEGDSDGKGGGSDGENTDGDDDADGKKEKNASGGQDSPGRDQADPAPSGRDIDDSQSLPETLTADALNEALKDAISTLGQHVYVDVPTFNYDMIVQDFSRHYDRYHAYAPTTDTGGLKEFKTTENRTVAYMVKEFERLKAASIDMRARDAKTGVLDTNKLYSYKFNDDIFKRYTVLPKGKNHGFVMFVDWSTSMAGSLRGTIMQLYTLMAFCQRVQIPFDVYLFENSQYSSGRSRQFSQGSEEIGFEKFHLINVFSSRMSASQFNTMFRAFWKFTSHGGGSFPHPLNYTPLDQTIVVAKEVVKRFQKATRVEVVNTVFLTDGGSNGTQTSHLFNGRPIVHIRDRETMAEAIVDYNTDNANTKRNKNSRSMTDGLLKLLKASSPMNLLGFYISSGAPDGISNNEYRAKGWAIDTSSGYDEYYYMDPFRFGVVNTLQKKSTSEEQAEEFIRFNQDLMKNRALAKRFIEIISTQIV